ncbi:hypothetical protein JKP88DRAFT_230679 [Tribonema minus]|uniref:PH domain-containing protein n=1 Tax=Tribonema minus TaxID=303371 RepID=A0A835ZE28_9STRA|nr:hypothetical protein JKP88DRAFT_230679 [Tribonema minus]
MAHVIRPQYQDPATGILYDCNNPDFTGYLTKQSSWLKDWRRRFFILKGSKLFFAKSEMAAPHGMIDLSSCMTVKSAEQKTHKRNALEVSTQDTTFFMFAGTEKEKDDWIGAIGRAIVQSSSTYQNEEASGDSDSDYEYQG